MFLDNRRRTLLGTKYEEMLACIRCGACLNVCPVYRHVSGHAYDAVYSGPMGKVLTPLLVGRRRGRRSPLRLDAVSRVQRRVLPGEDPARPI